MFEIFSSTHILLLCLIPVIIYISYLLRNTKHYHTILFTTSFLLFILELWKQYYYYSHGLWSVWIVPFQLCSIPLYIWIFYPIRNSKYFTYIETFLIDYTLLGALFALGYPEDMIKPQLVLTIHSFTWHYLLVFISTFIYFTRHGNLSIKGFIKGSLVFYICSMIAFILNLKLAKYGEISMFYINPYILSTQPVFHSIGLKWGIFVQNACYLLSISLGAFIINTIFKVTRKRG